MAADVKPGDKISIEVPQCSGCGVPAMELMAEILFGSEEHDMWVARIEGTKYHVLVSIDENENAVTQPCGKAVSIQHMIHFESIGAEEYHGEDEDTDEDGDEWLNKS